MTLILASLSGKVTTHSLLKFVCLGAVHIVRTQQGGGGSTKSVLMRAGEGGCVFEAFSAHANSLETALTCFDYGVRRFWKESFEIDSFSINSTIKVS